MHNIIILARYWELVTELGINHFYTTPSVIRKLMSNDKEVQSLYNLSSLRIIASGRYMVLMTFLQYSYIPITVGECLNKDAWEWFHKNFGDSKCHLIDTWWQTGKWSASV